MLLLGAALIELAHLIKTITSAFAHACARARVVVCFLLGCLLADTQECAVR